MIFHPIIINLGLITGIIIGSTAVGWTADDLHHGGHTGVSLTLNHGKPWTTDAPLRQGMEAISRDLDAALPRIHADNFSETEYQTLANQMSHHVEYMVKNCKLPSEVDAQVHLVLERILAGIEFMKSNSDQTHGVVMILQALDSYARYFDHPGWKPLNH